MQRASPFIYPHGVRLAMDPVYRESSPILPRNLAYVVAAVLIATLAFMAVSEPLFGAGMPVWMIAVSAVVFAAVTVLLLVLRMDVEVYGDAVEITYAFRRVRVEGREVIDVRRGELGAIRNYANWNLKGVKHRSYTRIGEDEGVALKLLGKRVVVFSTTDPEGVYAIVPREETSGEALEASRCRPRRSTG